MNILPDTHALAWWLESDPKLSLAAKAAIEADDAYLLLTTMVLVEIMYMGAKRQITEYLQRELDTFRQARDVQVLPIDEELTSYISTDLNIHDAIIVASALSYSARTGEPVQVITKDRQIAACGLVDCIW